MLHDEPPFTRCDCNILLGDLVADTVVEKYRVDWSLDSNFPDSATLFHFVTRVEDSFHVSDMIDSTYYYRVIAYETSVLYGPPSNTVFSTQDNNPPEIDGSLSVDDLWTTLDTFPLQYDIADPAGIDTIWFYFRNDQFDPWTLFSVIDGGGQTDISNVLAISTAIINEGITDAYFEFALGSRDLAREPAWKVDSDQPVGNDEQPELTDQPLGSISVDTHSPMAEIPYLDSLQVYSTFEIPISAHDTAADFYSGLDEVRGTIMRDSVIDGGVVGLPETTIYFRSLGGRASFDTVITFTASVNRAEYRIFLQTNDIAGNMTRELGPSTRVFTDLGVSMVLYSEDDPDDQEFTGSCYVIADLTVNSTHIDSLVLCKDGDFSSCAAISPVTITDGHIIVPYRLDQCSSGEHTVYAAVWLQGKLAIAQSRIILDTQVPHLTWLRIVSAAQGDVPWTSNPEISLNFFGDDGTSELQWIVLSEDEAFRVADSVLLYGIDFSGGVPFTLSRQPQRKAVFAKLVDMAEHESNVVSDTIDLYEQAHNYPNPFHPDEGSTNFVVAVAEAGTIKVRIYDLMGYLVTERSIAVSAGLNDGRVDPGLRWDGYNDSGEMVASGGYVCIIETSAGQLISRHKIMVKR